MSRDIVLEYWKIIRYKTLIIQCVRHISENVNPPKRIQQYSLNGDLLSEFDSVQKAAEWLYVNKKVKTLVSGVRGHISDAARGKIKSAYKYIWKYI